MVCRPYPVVLQVYAGSRRGDIHAQESSNAVIVQICCRNCYIWCRWALCKLKVGACKSSNPGMDVPDTCRSTSRRLDIIFEENGSTLLALSGDNHIRPFDCSRFAGLANLNNRFWVVDIIEEAAIRQNDRIRLAHDLRTSWDVDGLRHQIIAVVDKENLALRGGEIDSLLERLCVVGVTIASSTNASCTDEVAYTVLLVLWF